MITFQLREFAIPFFQHTLVVPTQDITFDENTNEYKYLQFDGCDHIVLKLVNINIGVLNKDSFVQYIDVDGAHKTQILPEAYDEFVICIIDKDDPYIVYDGFTHRQDVTP